MLEHRSSWNGLVREGEKGKEMRGEESSKVLLC